MLDFVKRLVTQRDGRPAGGRARHAHDELQVAAAALLVEVARLDGDFEPDERARIEDLMMERFALDRESAHAIVVAAAEEAQRVPEWYGFTRVVRDHFSHDERVQLIEMLWEVVYVDGRLHHHEANLLRRVAGLLYVTDRESGEARKRVLERLNAGE